MCTQKIISQSFLFADIRKTLFSFGPHIWVYEVGTVSFILTSNFPPSDKYMLSMSIQVSTIILFPLKNFVLRCSSASANRTVIFVLQVCIPFSNRNDFCQFSLKRLSLRIPLQFYDCYRNTFLYLTFYILFMEENKAYTRKLPFFFGWHIFPFPPSTS